MRARVSAESSVVAIAHILTRVKARRSFDTCQSNARSDGSSLDERRAIRRSTPTAPRCPSSCSPPRAARAGRPRARRRARPGRPSRVARRSRRASTAWRRARGARVSGPATCSRCRRRTCRAWAGVALGAMRAGGAVTGIPPGATEADLARQLAATRACVLVVRAGGGRAGAARRGRARRARASSALGRAPRRAADRRAARRRRARAGGRAAPERLALLPCSSGTTGLPKAVMLTHGNLAARRRAGPARARASARDDVVLGVAPFAHVMGFVAGLAAPLAAGATVVTLPRFELPALLAAVERHRVTRADRPAAGRRRARRTTRASSPRPLVARVRRLRRRAAGAGAPGAARRPAARGDDRPGLRA